MSSKQHGLRVYFVCLSHRMWYSPSGGRDQMPKSNNKGNGHEELGAFECGSTLTNFRK